MTDTITLPREVADYLMEVLEESPHHGDWSARDNVALAAFRTALAAEPTKHPGYIIGSHWLETAYSRICAGEAEADVLRDIGLVRIADGMAATADIHAIVDRQEALRRQEVKP